MSIKQKESKIRLERTNQDISNDFKSQYLSKDMDLYLLTNEQKNCALENNFKTVEIASFEQALPKSDWDPLEDSPYDPIVESNNEIVVVQKTGRRMYCRRCHYEWYISPELQRASGATLPVQNVVQTYL